jgi:hypothetical protein
VLAFGNEDDEETVTVYCPECAARELLDIRS